MNELRVIVTCPPMLGMIDEFRPDFEARGIRLDAPDVVQTMSEKDLIELVPDYDGWIIGDDPATRRVFEAGKRGRLKAVVKWGIGVDNVDFDAAHELGIPVSNTPTMFGGEVADVAMAYITGLARHLFEIDRNVRAGQWPKPRGVSLSEKTLGLVGFGDIGRNLARRAAAADMQILVYDPAYRPDRELSALVPLTWWDRLDEVDFLVFTCSLNEQNYHMLNTETLACCKKGVSVVNVARGSLVDQDALVDALAAGRVAAAALDVYEEEPLPRGARIRDIPGCILGSHNASNTKEAVVRASRRAMNILFEYLGE